MIRTLPMLAAIAASCTMTGIGAMAMTVTAGQSAMIGAEQPVFLGRMVVTATPLGADAAPAAGSRPVR